MTITSTSSTPFEKIFLDVVGPLNPTENNNKFILTFIDDLTKFFIAIPIPNQEANTIAKNFTTEIICKFGMPQTVLTDQGTNFESAIFRETCKLLKKKNSRNKFPPPNKWQPRENTPINRATQQNKEALELHPSLCKRWGPSLRQGLEEKMRTTFLEKYPHTTNFSECKAPLLDREIKRALDQLTLRRDKYQAYTQDKVGNTIAALGKSINKLLQSKLPKPLKDDILTDLNIAVLIQTEVFLEMSKSRRFLILPMLSPKVKEVVQDSESLFGGYRDRDRETSGSKGTREI
jgi:hypothetical protein